jgi:hypothetical protein
MARINYALAATMLAAGATLADAAAKCGAKNGNVLRVGLCRKGVYKDTATKLATSYELAATGVTPSHKLAAQDALKILAEQARQTLAETVSSRLQTVKEARFNKVGKDVALKHAQTLKSLAESGKIAFPSWNEPTNTSLVQINILNQLNENPPAEIIEAEIVTEKHNSGENPA